MILDTTGFWCKWTDSHILRKPYGSKRSLPKIIEVKIEMFSSFCKAYLTFKRKRIQHSWLQLATFSFSRFCTECFSQLKTFFSPSSHKFLFNQRSIFSDCQPKKTQIEDGKGLLRVTTTWCTFFSKKSRFSRKQIKYFFKRSRISSVSRSFFTSNAFYGKFIKIR